MKLLPLCGLLVWLVCIVTYSTANDNEDPIFIGSQESLDELSQLEWENIRSDEQYAGDTITNYGARNYGSHRGCRRNGLSQGPFRSWYSPYGRGGPAGFGRSSRYGRRNPGNWYGNGNRYGWSPYANNRNFGRIR